MVLFSKRIILNCAAIFWLVANIWILNPFINDSTIVYILHLFILTVNLLMFGLMAWFFNPFKVLSLKSICPFIVIIFWLIIPAVFAAFQWGVEVFFPFLLKKRSVEVWIYLFVCIFIYSFVFLLAKKRRQGSNGVTP